MRSANRETALRFVPRTSRGCRRDRRKVSGYAHTAPLLEGQTLLISLFITCYNDALFPQTGRAVVAVLERLGHTVEFRSAQTCCGQMHFNSGYRKDALSLMRHFVEVFHDAEVVCCPSSSCVSMMREYYPSLAASTGDAELIRRVDALLPRVFEFSELLVDKLGVTDVGAFYPH
ncbi:MAG: cysteine-rich domain protein, partial [Armatimonadetes bacterium]|nr:cysteine-rich domain protein [Armatimonadota bacterium]